MEKRLWKRKKMREEQKKKCERISNEEERDKYTEHYYQIVPNQHSNLNLRSNTQFPSSNYLPNFHPKEKYQHSENYFTPTI